MNRRNHPIRCNVAAWLAVVAALGCIAASARAQVRLQGDDALEILTRGPVHEAFAETITFDPEPGLVAPKRPPNAIEELPPEYQPEGDNIAWIPGYWAWDDDREDFLWVSGIWRAMPPGRQWVSGYWARSDQGAQWTSGFWADAQQDEVEYLPEPPATMEVGPNVPAPSDVHSWLPGSWVWQQDRYAWRPGYWAPGQTDWIWVPAHYIWTPRGYVFVDGYFDHTVERRGVLFAPVYFRTNVYTRRGFSYSPLTVINPAVFTNHLFLRPDYGHYYFGDYYGANYVTRGFSPWFAFHSTRTGYDPFYAQQRWQHRDNPQWYQGLESEFVRRRDNESARPPRTWRSQRERTDQPQAAVDDSYGIGRSFDEVIQNKVIPGRFQPLAPEDRQRIGKRVKEILSTFEERQTLESQGVEPRNVETRTVEPRAVESRVVEPRAVEPRAADRAVGPPKQPAAAVRVRLPKSKIVGPPREQLDQKQAPPTVIEPPRPDPRVKPQPRKPRGGRGTPPAANSREKDSKDKDDDENKGKSNRGGRTS